ncbi:MAG: DUF998 domain-containing protein [Thermoplasmatota archaeon]
MAPDELATARVFGTWGLAGVGIGLAIVVALHVVEPSIRWSQDPISDYADTPHAKMLEPALVAMGLGGLFMALALTARHALGAPVQRAARMLAASAVIFFGLALWPDGFLHLSLARVGTGILLVAVGLLAVAVRDRPSYRGFTLFSWLVVALAACGVIGVQGWLPDPGYIQRGYFLLVVVWFGFAGRIAMAA